MLFIKAHPVSGGLCLLRGLKKIGAAQMSKNGWGYWALVGVRVGNVIE